MQELPDFAIDAHTGLCALLREHAHRRFAPLARHVQQLPYGRVDVGGDPGVVISLARGTCSSKHRLLAQVALECDHDEIRLAVGIYLMSEANTPGVGAVLAAAGLRCIPEAHCYLICQGERFDLTREAQGQLSPFESLQEESLIDPMTLHLTKVPLHQRFLQQWATAAGRSPHELWRVREACIEALQSGLTPGSSPF
jgi:hypothetical protein